MMQAIWAVAPVVFYVVLLKLGPRYVPPPRRTDDSSAFGCMAGTAREEGDIVEPLPPEDWEALR